MVVSKVFHNFFRNEGKYDAKEIAGWAKWDIEKVLI